MKKLRKKKNKTATCNNCKKIYKYDFVIKKKATMWRCRMCGAFNYI